MPENRNEARTLQVGLIEKNPFLALSTNEKEVERYEWVAKVYGNVAPAVVGRDGNAYRILSGQAGLEACAQIGIKEMPVVVAQVMGEAEQMKLALLLTTLREGGGPLSEGAFIDALIMQHGVTRREIMGLLKKSKSWVSKRQSLATRLSQSVKELVKGGVICARTAEEVARLPEEVQFAFASVIVRDGLSKTDAGRLAGLYVREESGTAVREAILETPLSVLDACPVGAVARRVDKRGLAERLAGSAGFLIRMAHELKGLLAKADPQSLEMVCPHLRKLRVALVDLKTVVDMTLAGVSPGGHRGGDAT